MNLFHTIRLLSIDEITLNDAITVIRVGLPEPSIRDFSFCLTQSQGTLLLPCSIYSLNVLCSSHLFSEIITSFDDCGCLLLIFSLENFIARNRWYSPTVNFDWRSRTC